MSHAPVTGTFETLIIFSCLKHYSNWEIITNLTFDVYVPNDISSGARSSGSINDGNNHFYNNYGLSPGANSVNVDLSTNLSSPVTGKVIYVMIGLYSVSGTVNSTMYLDNVRIWKNCYPPPRIEPIWETQGFIKDFFKKYFMWIFKSR